MTFPIIDAHQHIWDPSRARYDWLGPEMAPIDRAIGFDEVVPLLAAAGVDRTVLVQSADNLDDTALMVEAAASYSQVAGIVAYAPLERPDDAAPVIAAYAADPLIVGVRVLIHTIPDPDWLLRPEVDESLGLLEAAGLTFDVVAVLPRHLELVPILAQRHPGLKMVIDHLSKPPIGLADREPWWSLIAEAASGPLVHAKVSGLYSATADMAAWTPESVRPFVDRALELFGPTRLMYAGDWPISILAGGYQRVWEGLAGVFADLPSADREHILGRTAAKFYSLDEARLGVPTA
jgi:L-fuconolactonase